MDENRKGICTNIGNCKNADSKLPIEVPLTADFVCPECERELMEVKRKKPFPIKKMLLIITLLSIIGLLVWGSIALFSGKENEHETNSDLMSKISDIDKTENPINNQASATQSETQENQSSTTETSKETPEKKTETYNLTANTIEEYFQKIADSIIPYDKKDKLKQDVVAKYFSEDGIVVEIGKNNTEVGHTGVKDYVEELSQQHYKIKITDKQLNNNKKINKLFIKEL